jgi:uncharacterized protein YjdB
MAGAFHRAGVEDFVLSLVRRSSVRPSQFVQGMLLVGALALGASCSDGNSTAPNNLTVSRASLSIAPTFQAIAPAIPAITLSRIVGTLIGPRNDSTVVQSVFARDTALLAFDVHFSGASELFTLDIAAYDLQGVIAYRGSEQILIKTGKSANIVSPTLLYAAPDAKLTSLHVISGGSSLPAGSATPFTVAGTGANGVAITPIHVGWSSSDVSVATVDDNGVVRAGSFEGSTYIIARTALNLVDSVSVKIKAPVNKISIAPAPAELLRGNLATLKADLRDIGDHPIDGRTVAWTTSDASIATVSADGVVSGLKIGTATITATVEGMAATSLVNVLTPLDHIKLTPAALSFVSLTATATITPNLVAKTGGSTAGSVVIYKTSDSSVARIDDKGTVTAVGNGAAKLTASADGVADTANVTVKQVTASLVVLPKVSTVLSLGASTTFVATAYDAMHVPFAAASIAWTTSNPSIAVISPTGTATAVRAGSAAITATADGLSDVGTFNVSPVGSYLLLLTDKVQIAIGGVAVLKPKLVDANGNVLGDVTATLTNTTPGIAVLTGNTLTGLTAGTAHVNAVFGGLTAGIDVLFLGSTSVANSVTVNPPQVVLGSGSDQQFSVVEDVPVTWSVNGIVGGNSAFGTINTQGLYRAPTLASGSLGLQLINVCAAAVNFSAQGCARVSINAPH